ncbi:tol-pal system YbgF family protein [Chryseobacterium potabilaquae]|uniref:Lipoprotein n=1 Tax=Chryseobacterium potabilaquae TaxID=2675057 RepID=A0A6N4XC84_9FLAO|nr:hypothetical protein [Chryseobacterium potabilaquae]CAA7196639.1 hypothetical protein CHRY9293_02718 [Chryseobacterium potabilaquae]
MIKKRVAAFILLIVILSCKKNEQIVTGRNIVHDTLNSIVTKEDSYRPIDTVCSPNNKTKDYIEALQWYNDEVRKEVAMNPLEKNNRLYKNYLKIRDKYIQCISEINGDVLDKYVNYYDSENGMYKFPEDIKTLSAELKKVNLEFREVGEGYTEVWSDSNYYYNIFKNSVTFDYNAYIKQLSIEDKVNYAEDAGIVISWKELGDRVIFWENFIKKYPKSDLMNVAKEKYNNYLYDYLFGMDNTPTYERADGKLYDENKDEFNRIIKKYPNSETAKKVQELLDFFESQISVDQIHDKISLEKKY